MINGIDLILGLTVGIVAGAGYFGGLWWTVRRLPTASHVWGLYFGSLLVRVAFVLGAFYLLLVYCAWPAWAACLIGFIACRLILVQGLGRTFSSEQAVE